eukprot:TRINITY_DN22500_c0_g1_i1.p1 TRINITY_DN22500_c0_g1~~TRINITY_DN22500_c0_g1_i1.p1  ORF type:complete len:546 (+),score=227.28 TRINITY_DN22500_c0_g1_i1:87-1640(+)
MASVAGSTAGGPAPHSWGDCPQILCCVCGVAIDANPSNMCVNCIRTSVDITAALPREAAVSWCRICDRYLQPPKYWSPAALESRELMAICLKRIRGLPKMHLVDASWIWTEPHSRRLKIKLTVQKEVFAGTVVQQSTVIEFVVNAVMCEGCQRVATGHETWGCSLQVRQRVDHKKMLLFVEQLILKHDMHKDVMKCKQQPDGIDFFMEHKSQAMKLMEFVQAVAPCRRKDGEQLISSDVKNNTAHFHYSLRLDIAPVCKDDLVCLTRKQHLQYGAIGPVLIIIKMYANIVVLDPRTLQAHEIAAKFYWQDPIPPLATRKHLVEYYVVDVEPLRGAVNGKYQLADITVCRESEVGQGKDVTVRSHLGGVLREGDSVMGYDLSTLNSNNDAIGEYREEQLPPLVLIRKHYPHQAERRRRRRWRIRQLPNKEGPSGISKAHEAREAAEMDEFLDELERDPEFRSNVKLFKDPQADAMTATTAFGDDEARVNPGELLDDIDLDEDDSEEAGAAPPADGDED